MYNILISRHEKTLSFTFKNDKNTVATKMFTKINNN